MNDFIELHAFETNEAFLINKKNIVYIEPQYNKNGNFCLICTVNERECWTPVKEDYKTIKDILKSSEGVSITSLT